MTFRKCAHCRHGIIVNVDSDVYLCSLHEDTLSKERICVRFEPEGSAPGMVYQPKCRIDAKKLPVYPKWKVVDWFACDRCDNGLVIEVNGVLNSITCYERHCLKCGWIERGEVYHGEVKL